jgi:hypothetical protein
MSSRNGTKTINCERVTRRPSRYADGAPRAVVMLRRRRAKSVVIKDCGNFCALHKKRLIPGREVSISGLCCGAANQRRHDE